MPRFARKVVWDIATLKIIEREGFDYTGPIEFCKGESKKQMNINNQVASQQLAMQQQQIAQYNNYVKQLLAGGGYLPGVKQALTSQAISSVPNSYDQIARNLQTAAMARGLAGGGSLPGGGGYLAGYGNLLSQEEQTKANLLNNITAGGQQNINAAEGGVLNAAGITSNAGTSALGSATTAANQANQSSGLLGTIIGGGLGVLGSYLGKPGCWVAAELYGGWFAPETQAIRNLLRNTWWLRPFHLLYLRIGPDWAIEIRKNPRLRKITKKLFALFLRMAHA